MDIDKALVERMVTLVRDLAEYPSASVSDAIGDAKEIVALLPKPVDPLLEEAREWYAAHWSGDLASEIIAGNYDDDLAIQAYLAGARRAGGK